MAKHYIADEALGGIEREYRESDKKAEVGDYVVITEDIATTPYKKAGEIVKIVEVNGSTCDGMINPHDYGEKGAVYHFQSRTLITTGNVRIGGEVFRMVDRKAKVGEKVLYYYEDKSDGIVTTVTGVGVGSVDIEPYAETDVSYVSGYNHGAYRVLESVEPSEATEDSPQATPDVAALIANLAQEVVKLRKQVEALSERTDSNAKDIRTFAETATEAKHLAETVESNLGDIAERQRNQYVKISDLRDDVNMLTDDVILLDERTQLEELAETVLGNITIRRAGGIRNGQSIYSY